MKWFTWCGSDGWLDITAAEVNSTPEPLARGRDGRWLSTPLPCLNIPVTPSQKHSLTGEMERASVSRTNPSDRSEPIQMVPDLPSVRSQARMMYVLANLSHDRRRLGFLQDHLPTKRDILQTAFSASAECSSTHSHTRDILCK